MPILLKISARIVAHINEGKNHYSVFLQYNLVHGTVSHIYGQYVVMGSFTGLDLATQELHIGIL